MAQHKDNYGRTYPGQTVEIDGSTTGGLATSSINRIAVQSAGPVYDARLGSKSVPIYTINPTAPLAVLDGYRAVLSSFRHNFLWACGSSIAAGYFALFVISGGLNLLRSEPKYQACEWFGCLSPVALGTNLTSWGRVTVVEPIANSSGDFLLNSTAGTPVTHAPIKPARAKVRE